MIRYDNETTGWPVKVALAIFVFFGASQSYAACSQSDLTGTWYFNGVTGDTFLGEFWETDYCKVKINSAGKIVKSVSQCKFRDFAGKGNFDITGGSLLIGSSCLISGRIKYGFDEFSTYFYVDSARLDKGKTVITMVGRVSIDPDVVSFLTGVKR